MTINYSLFQVVFTKTHWSQVNLIQTLPHFVYIYYKMLEVNNRSPKYS